MFSSRHHTIYVWVRCSLFDLQWSSLNWQTHTQTHTHTHMYMYIFHTIRPWIYIIKRNLYRPEQVQFLLVCHFYEHVLFTYYHLMKHIILQFTGAWNLLSILREECGLSGVLRLRRRRKKQLLIKYYAAFCDLRHSSHYSTLKMEASDTCEPFMCLYKPNGNECSGLRPARLAAR